MRGMVTPESESELGRSMALTISDQLAHARLGDLATSNLIRMAKHGSAKGLEITRISDDSPCTVCTEANLRHADIPRSRTRNLAIMDVLGCDLQQFDTVGHEGSKYLAIYVDYASGCLVTQPLKQKSDQALEGLAVVERFEASSGRRLKTLRADQGGEYTSKVFVDALRSKGIKMEYSDTDQPFQNGLAEVIGGKIVSMMRAAFVRSAVPQQYWPENAAYQTWVHNRVSLQRQKGRTTPIEDLTGHQADVSRARVFGCEAWVIIRRQTKMKLQPRAERAVNLGVSHTKKAWIVLLWNSRKIVESRNVTFVEDVFPFKSSVRFVDDPYKQKSHNITPDNHGEDRDTHESSDDEFEDQGGSYENDDESHNITPDNHGEDRDTHDRSDDEFEDQGGSYDDIDGAIDVVNCSRDGGDRKRRSTRVRFMPDRFSEIDYAGMTRASRCLPDNENNDKDCSQEIGQGVDEVLAGFEPSSDQEIIDGAEDVVYDALGEHGSGALLCSADDADNGWFAMLAGEVSESISDPKSENEARTSHEQEEWRKAEQEEFQALMDEGVADVVDRPQDAVVLPSKFVYKTKRDEQGKCERRKARFVPLGCCDPWKALKETFSPTLRYATLRVIIALAAKMGAIIHQLDVKTAFLNGVLKTVVYVEQPTGFETGDPTKKVWRLKKALYGLVEAPRLWYETLHQVLDDYGFCRIVGDPCLYVLKRNSHVAILGVFVDDFLIFGTSDEMVIGIKRMLGERFKTKDLGHARWVLGMRLIQTTSECVLDQSQYLRDVLTRFQVYMKPTRGRAPSTPLPIGMDLRRAKDGDDMVDLPFRELLGSIGHLANGTRIDVAFPVSLLSRFVSRPSIKDWKAAIQVLHYLAGNDKFGLVFKKEKKVSEFRPLLLNDGDTTEPSACTDSDFANDPDTGKSVGGMIVSLCGTAVAWRSKLQSVVATSTCHAEYVAMFEGAREVHWMRMLLEGIGFVLKNPSVISVDNAAAKMTAESVGISDANKHIKVKYHRVRECVSDGIIQLRTVASKNNPSDGLTKAPTPASLNMMREGSNLMDFTNISDGDDHFDQGGCLRDRKVTSGSDTTSGS